jgi:hypothetical protein
MISDSRNIRHTIVDDDGKKIQTTIEAVITVMTRKMQFSGSGLVQTEDLESMRFEMTISAARRLIEHMEDWIESAEQEHDQLSLIQSNERL